MPKATTPNSRKARHDPLENEYLATGILKAPKQRKSKGGNGKDNEREEGFIDAKASRKILQIGRELIEENEAAPPRPPTEASAFGFDSRFEEEGNDAFEEDGDVWNDDDDDDVEEDEIEVDDLATFNKFMPTENQDPLLQHGWPGQEQHAAPEQSTNLADLIMAKIAAHESGGGATLEPRDLGPPDEEFELPPKVVEVYTKIGMWLARYKSGQLPKPFKILPTIPNWEHIIELTKPDEWTPNACYAATRIFVSSTPIVVQRFAEMVLLEHVRSDIYETKKLNVHLFNALKKLLYKPASFFKGFLFPLVNSVCTLREATIISAVLSRVSIPALHSAAALKGLCDIAAEQTSNQGTEAAGATNVFIKTLLEKKYALPFQVIDALVFHFLRFRSQDPAAVKEGDVMMDVSEERAAMQHKLPVIWHQCLLAFAQRYRNDITEDQREVLLDLLLTHGHHSIGPEVRRELLAGRGRGVPLEQATVVDGDDTMLVD
ncbi:Bystin-domain-containing protein [Apiospora phragmitis]|uniref:Bystin-domain-containing protein n=1 Tax=Apiospora phragmitis TaxID=2905665 RepID=A0ABR1X694_9PEZI